MPPMPAPAPAAPDARGAVVSAVLVLGALGAVA